MDSYLHKIPTGGKGYIEFLDTASFPSWSSADEGRLVYNLYDDNLYFGSDTQWVTVSNAGWLSRLVPGGGSAGQALTKSSPSNYDVTWSSVGGGGIIAIDQNPIGSIIAWPADTTPTGFLECNGQAISRTTYADLFGVIGVTYGDGDGSTTFNVPDYRGYFLRGYDGSAGVDPDKTSRTDRGDGTVGNNVGTKQEDEFEAHTHPATKAHYSSLQGTVTNYFQAAGPSYTTTANPALGSQGGNETRAKNIYVKFCIKYMLSAVQEVPAGTIVYSASVGTPDGFEDCDGAVLNRTSYSELYNSIGLFFSDIVNVYSTTPNSYLEKLDTFTGAHVVHGYSTGDEVTFQTSGTLPSPLIANTSYWVRQVDINYFTLHPTSGDAIAGTNKISITNNGTGSHFMYLAASFKIPDLRGQYIRTYDDGAGVDNGRVFGSYQADDQGSHFHYVAYYPHQVTSTVLSSSSQTLSTIGYMGDAGYILAARTDVVTANVGKSSPAGSASELRTKNFALNAYIKW